MVTIDSGATKVVSHPTPATVAAQIGTKVVLPPASVEYDWVDLLDKREESRVQPGDVVEVEFEAPLHTGVGVILERFTWRICIANTRTKAQREGFVTGLSLPMQRPWERPCADDLYDLFVSQVLAVDEEFSYGYIYGGDHHGEPRQVGRITCLRVRHRPER